MKYEVLDTYKATVKTIVNPYDFEQQQLFDMALRINKKRRFLFVSHVLGKHLAVDPAIPLLTGHLLAYRFNELRFQKVEPLVENVVEALQNKQDLRKVLVESQNNKIMQPVATTIIGFAETATALGHGFFEKLGGDISYIHTTREHLVDIEPVICFEEEHSHATSHRVYADESIFLRECEIVLVDDEMTTGKTNCNIIRQLHEKYPHLTTFTLVSILDFRTQQYVDMVNEVAAELNINIHCVSIYTGEFQIEETGGLFDDIQQEVIVSEEEIELDSTEKLLPNSLVAHKSYSCENIIKQANYYEYSGRFKLTSDDQQKIAADVSRVAEDLHKKRSSGSCLVIGTGEFMYIPMSIANEMGEDIRFHATTRSPIYANEQSLIYNKLTFESAELPGVTNFLYNIPKDTYSDIFVIYERIMDRKAAQALYAQLKPYAEHLHFVTLGGVALELYTG